MGSLTGSERWMAQEEVLHQGADAPAAVPGEGSCWEPDTAPVALANEMFPARNFREQDTVISI